MTQLTLTLDDQVVKQARELAAKAGKSMEAYISDLVTKNQSTHDWEASLPPITRSLLGIAPPMTDEEAQAVVEEALLERANRK